MILLIHILNKHIEHICSLRETRRGPIPCLDRQNLTPREARFYKWLCNEANYIQRYRTDDGVRSLWPTPHECQEYRRSRAAYNLQFFGRASVSVSSIIRECLHVARDRQLPLPYTIPRGQTKQTSIDISDEDLAILHGLIPLGWSRSATLRGVLEAALPLLEAESTPYEHIPPGINRDGSLWLTSHWRAHYPNEHPQSSALSEFYF